ncbi:protein FAR1-RELATED SEQUENCE 5-like [Triticum dicoccoides]|uniref:protein FAR1-RELATED SEQUENCE 5-like n=1 Tax=Triticum dicoccoides TaxID=85692 RepID=UPI001890A7DA|nr:protein FAR1-RELATED SEQUENCE 5-like [Triticum dicoccoides]
MECQSEVSKAPSFAICDVQSDAESAVHTRPSLDIGFTTPQKSYSAPFCGSSCTLECDDAIRPAIGMTFADLNAAKEFYEAYAHHVGFSVRVGQQKIVNGVITHKRFYCDREGFREERKGKETLVASTGSKRRYERKITRCGCEAKLAVKRTVENKYIVTLFEQEHTHTHTCIT